MSYGARPDNPSFLTEQKPLRGTPGSDFIADLIDAENQLMKFGQRHPECVTTILRFGNMLGPHVNTFMSRLLACHLSPRLMGYDPLVQFIHERDALRALKTALDEDHPGAFNIVADGVLHLSAVDRIAGQVALPIPHFLSQRLGNFLWTLQACPIPPRLLDYLRYPCVADGQRARNELGFEPRYSTRDTLLDFTRNLGVGSTPGKPGAGA
jgi:UDP-glucose 4-epimerase